MNTYTIFRAYRYQLLPLDRNQTKDLYHDRTTAEIVEKKNGFFADALKSLPRFNQPRGDLNISFEQLGDEFLLLRLAPSRPLTRETADQRREQVENWPHIDVYVLNSPDDQLLIIQDRVAAFANTDTVANMIRKGTRGVLERFGLSLQIEPLFNEEFFWSTVEQYRNSISWIDFEFVTPNMANISKVLEKTLKDLGKETNSVRENLRLRSDPLSSLDISPDNPTIHGLVEYTSKGTGDIKLKIKGLRKVIQTSNSRRVVSLSGVELAAGPEALMGILKELLK